MATKAIEVPSFDYAAFYYPQILEALLLKKRQDVPELTDESEFEPYIQLLRSFAVVGHLNNTLLDMVANEFSLPTAQLVETVRHQLQLIGYNLASASPAGTELVYELARVFSAPFDVIPDSAQAATRNNGNDPVIHFEAIEGVTISRSDRFTSVQSSDGGVFTDRTAAANDGTNFSPWATPTGGDALYFGHDSVMWNQLWFNLVSPALNITGVWEYFDGNVRDTQPSAVVDIGGAQLQFDLTSLLGAFDRRGAAVRVTFNTTGVSEDVLSTWNGSANIATTGLLAQTSPSTVASDYSVGSEWSELGLSAELALADASAGLTIAGELAVNYVLPQTEQANWQKTAINGVTAFWLRFRIVTVSGPTSPVLARCRMDVGRQYVIATATQGRTVSDDPVGSSNGAPNQEFETTRDYFVDGSEIVYVDGEEWTRVDNFLSSGPLDKHYRILLGNNDRATIRMGDGTTGRIPPLGQGNISIDYRFDAALNGNVGANTISVDKTGLTYITKIFNPRQASGWAEAEGASEASLARAKLAGPASLRTKEVALNGDDAVVLAKAFRSTDGTKPFGRATYIEGGFGPKTLELILTGAGGGIPSATHLREIERYFNGDKYAIPPVAKRFVANQEVVAVAFDPHVINVTAHVVAREGVTVEQIVNGLNQILHPDALKSDGLTPEWEYAGRVPVSRLQHVIFKVDEALIEDVDITVPASDVVLSNRSLPVAGAINITISAA
jgi:hypothetical protein